MVKCSRASFSGLDEDDNLHSYAPAFIKVSWRAVKIQKPTHCDPNVAKLRLRNSLKHVVNEFPKGFNVPARPQGVVTNGLMYTGTIAGFPALLGNGFDGDIEIHQQA
ncbi:hypothetical protein THII_3687 [Thioploca ingrica]|uniref:Uncharacterized protein n=1 Tax=Thioploca ingrica TaxID=40754 RepID=A0A090AKB0_9GAMM|nr:hypothetical protein THII_3687 [Thioploca ingrica]